MSSGTPTNHLRGVWGSSSSDVFAVGDSGTILHYRETPSMPPVIASISPSKAVQGQDNLTVTITGTYFLGATAVSFGADVTVSDNVNVKNSTQITVVVSVGSSAALGARDVSVTAPAGTGTLPKGFKVTRPSPTISSIDPSQGVQGQTLTVTITGSNFEGATSPSLGTGISVDNFTVGDDGKTIAAVITISDTATTGVRNVSVTTEAGTGTLGSGLTITPREVPTKESNSSKIWIGIGIGAGILVAGAAIAYLVVRRRASEDARRPARKK
jgi:hypothetical protein